MIWKILNAAVRGTAALHQTVVAVSASVVIIIGVVDYWKKYRKEREARDDTDL